MLLYEYQVNEEVVEAKLKEVSKENILTVKTKEKNNNNDYENNVFKIKKFNENKNNENKDNSFKIEIEVEENSLNNVIIQIINNYLEKENKKDKINSIVRTMKSLTKEDTVKLINYVSNKYNRINTNKISSKDKYIIAMFINFLSSRDYIIEDYNNSQNINYYGKRKSFINFEQPKIDFGKLKQL